MELAVALKTIDILKAENKEILKDNKEVKEKNKKLEHEVVLLREELRLAIFNRFGKSSEKIVGQEELPFAIEYVPEEKKEEVVETQDISYTRKKPGRKKLSDDLPREHYYFDLSEEEKICSCGHRMKKIGEDVNEVLSVIPEQIWVDVNHKAKYACSFCQGVNDSNLPAVKTAKAEEALIPKSIASPSLLAFILTNKYCDHLPFYRQEKRFERIGANISRQDMSNWLVTIADMLMPLKELLRKDIISNSIIRMDETPVKVLKLDHSGKDGIGYMWLMLGGKDGKRSVLYNFAPGRGAIHARNFLGSFNGVLQSDGYHVYDSLSKELQFTQAGCWAHVRRLFFEADKVAPSALVSDALGRIRKIFTLETQARQMKLKDEEFLSYRRSLIEPYLKDLKLWAEKTASEVLPQGKTKKAFAYMLGQWPKLDKFLDYPELTPDNNLAENAIRPFVLGRKNWLFNGNDTGAESACLIYSLIESAKNNGLNPYSYLHSVFKQLPQARDTDNFESLLPWNIKIP